MAIKLVAIDMDGTLLNPQHEITAGVKSAIDRVHKKGVAVVLATGRPYVGIQRYLMELGLVDEGHYYISYNGALVAAGKRWRVRGGNYAGVRRLPLHRTAVA